MDIKSKLAGLIAAAVVLTGSVGNVIGGVDLGSLGITASAEDNEALAETIAAPVLSSTISTSSTSAMITWSSVSGATGYNIYRRTTDSWNMVTAVSGSTTSYVDSSLKSATSYGYYVVAYTINNGAPVYSNNSNSVYAATLPGRVNFKEPEATYDSITLKWNAVSCTGYNIKYKKKGASSWTTKTVQTSSSSSYTVTGLTELTEYVFTIQPYVVYGNNQTAYGTVSSALSVTTPKHIIVVLPTFDGEVTRFADCDSLAKQRLDSASLSPKTQYPWYNAQSSSTYLEKNITLTARDKVILDNFAATHFNSSMTAADKVNYTLRWINRNVVYANGEVNAAHPRYADIYGYSYVEAIFVKHAGQCVQYNGALTAMMTYLGYDCALVQGYRGNSSSGSYWQHFWEEVYINGQTYIMECGNYGEDGDWLYVCRTYHETTSAWSTSYYMLNGRYMT